MAEDWGINDPVVDDEEGLEFWGENDPVIESEQNQEEDWGVNDQVVGAGVAEPAVTTRPVAPSILQQYDEVAQSYKKGAEALGRSVQRFEELSSKPERTPEEEVEMAQSWRASLQGQADLSKKTTEIKRLQPEYDKYFADQKQARINYIEDRRGSGVFGDEAAEALYDLDSRAEQEYTQARTIEDADKRKEAMAAIQAKYQAEEKNLTNQFVDRFKENETKINNAAEVIGQAFAKGQSVDQFLLETNADAEEFSELRESLINQDDPEKGKLFREARAMVDLAEGAEKVGIVNNEIRVSPLHVWDAEGIKSEINALDISDAKKRKAIATIPQLQQEAVKVELPFLQQIDEFNDFIKDNKLENVSPQRQVAEWKNRNENWLDQVGKLPAQVGIGLKTGTLGLLEAGQAIVGATALTMGAQEFADPFLDAATKTSDEIQRLNRISQEIGGPTFAAELAAVVPQIVTQIGVGGAVGFGGTKLGLKPKMVSNIGFGSSVGTALAQSYGGVLSSAFQQLEKEKIDDGMDPVQARAEAVKEAQLPAALSGLSTAIVTTLGGKRGAEAVFREGADGIKAKLNTVAFRNNLDEFVPNVVKGMRNEGYEEFADQLAQGIIEQFSFNPQLSTSDIVNNAFKALAIGGITGGTVEGLKYGFDYMKSPKEMARREQSMASIRQSIADVEKEISITSASSPIGAEFQREYDATLPSDEAANLGGVAVDRTRMNALQAERQQLSELLEDTTISKVARNQLEGKLAAADIAYYNEVLTPMRRNVVNEQMVDQLEAMDVSDQTKDGLTAIAKIANGLGAESLTGRERVAVGITSVGEGRFLPSRKNPMVEVNQAGEATVTEAGRLMAENVGMVPLVRMIGLSESTRAKQAEMERLVAEAEARRAQQEAKDLADSEEAQRYGPASAEALKEQVAVTPPVPETETNTRLAQLLKEQEEIARKATEAVTGTIETRFIESFRSTMSEAIIPTAERAATIDLNNFRDVINSIAQEIDKGTFNIEMVEQGEFKNILPEQAFTTVVEAFKENPQRALNALRAFGDEVENAVKEFGGGAAGEAPENLEPLLRVARAEQTPEDVTALTESGMVEIYKDQPILTQAGIDALPEAERPRLTPEARKVQIDTGANEVVAEAISKGLRIGVDQVGPNVTLPEGWTLDGDIYIPPAPPTEPLVTLPVEPPVAPPVEPPVTPPVEPPIRPSVAPQVTPPSVQPPVTPPVTPPPTVARQAEITPTEANRVIESAKKERSRKPPREVPYRGRQATPLAPKDIIGKSARQALLVTSRLNLSKIANRSPNEIMMQDVAAILAELDAPILDSEKVVSLSSIKRRGRARRVRLTDGRTVVAMPSSIRSTMETLVHEVGHTITADMVAKYVPRRKTGRGQNYLNAINKAIADPATPEPVQRLFTLYVSAIEQLGITEQFFGAGGIAGAPDPDTSVALARSRQAKGQLREDLNGDQLYGLANVEEFVSQTFSEPIFRDLLKTLKDPTNPQKTLWRAFVEAIQNILQLPRESLAAAVIEASVDIGMITPPSGVRARRAAAPTPSPRKPRITDLDVQHGNAIASGDEDTAQSLTDEVATERGYQSQNLLFHGTTHIFNVFTKDRANVENDFGKGYYLTNTEADAQINYAGEGPDLTNRIERLSEQLQSNEDLDEAEARKRATEILSGGGQRIMRVYVRLNNPFNVGGPNETFLDYDTPYDEATEEYGEPTGKLAEFLQALRPIIESYAENSPVDADKAIGNIVEYAVDRGGISASELVKILKQEDSGIMWASDENGDLASSEIIRQAIEDAGFDGIVDNLVNEKFGRGKKIGKAMAGMGPDTVHTIVFNSNQIKSADFATYDDQGNLIPLSQRFLAEEEDVRFAPEEEEFVIIPEQVEDQIEGTPEATTMGVMGEALRLANEQSAAAGTPEGTLPTETIVNAWMSSGRDVANLRNAIVRYTNLEPEVAATLGDAIAQQLEIQRGIMEISDAASRRKVEKEADPEERPYSFAQRIKEDLPPALRSKINKAYEVLRNDVSVQEANQVMYGMTVDEAMRATMDMQNGVFMGVRSMMAQITLRKIIEGRKNARSKRDKASYDALVESHVDFVDWINEYLVEMGQGIQAFARFSDLGADGMLLKLRKDTNKIIARNIGSRKAKIDKIKRDVEEADNGAFKAAINSNKDNIDRAANKAGEREAKQLTIEEQAQKLAQRAAKRVAGEEIRRREPDPLSDLVNGHLRRYNANFIAEATAMGVSPVTAQAIEDSAKKLRDMRQAARTERDQFQAMQDERIRVKKELARENKYIYGDRPTIWEDYQQMFSERLARRLMRDPKKKVPPSLLLFTDRLTENLLGFVPQAERQATTPRSFQAMIEDALNNKEKYQEAFSKAMEDISLKVMELEARRGGGEAVPSAEYKRAVAAQEFMERLEPTIQQFPVSDKLVIRFVNQKMKATGESLVAKYNEWYRSSRQTRIGIEKALADQLVENMNIGSVDAINLSQAIIKDFRVKAEERREKALARFKKPKEKTKRLAESPLKKFFELVNIGAMTDQDAYEVMAHRFDLPTWDPKFAQQVEEMAKLIQDMPDGLERRRMTRNLMAEIAKNRGFNIADLGAGFAYSNILSSPDTLNTNFADTLINNFSNAFADAVAEKDFTRLRGLMAGYSKGWSEAVQVFKTGLRINMPRLEEKSPLPVELVNYGKKGGVKLESTEGLNAIAKTILESPPAKVLNLWKYVTRIMEATDALNYTASSEGQLYADASRIAREEGLQGIERQRRINEILNLGDDVYQAALKQAEQEGYTGVDAKFRAMEIQDSKIDPELKEQSFERGLRDVYRNMPKGLAGYFAARFDRTVSGIENPWIRNSLKLGISPFVITPTNLFNKWLDWSPYGYKRLFLGSGAFLSKEGPYRIEPPKAGSAEFYAQAFKASSSVFVMGLALGLVKAGLLELVGRGPSDEEERKQWLADGNKPYTFRFLNGPQISFQYSPWALFLSLAANISNWEKYSKKEDATLLDRSIAGFIAVTGVIMDLPFFAGPAEFLKSIEAGRSKDFTAGVSKYVEGKMGMVFPNFLRYIDRLFDPTVYDHQGIKAIILDQTPFARRLGIQRVNLFGEPIGQDKPTLDRLLGRFVGSPIKPSRESRILAKYDIYPYMPSPKRAKALVDGVEAQMTEEQYNKFVQLVGKEAKQRINDLFDPDAEITEQEKERGRKRISEIFERARARAVREVSTY